MAADNSPPGNAAPNDVTVAVSNEALLKAESFVEQEEGAANRLMGWAGKISTTIAVVMSLFHLYAAYAIVPTQELRYTHVAFTLVLSFLLFPVAMRFRNRVRWWDIVPGIFAVATIGYALWGGDDFTDRATSPDRWDVIGRAPRLAALVACEHRLWALTPTGALLVGAGFSTVDKLVLSTSISQSNATDVRKNPPPKVIVNELAAGP